MNEPQQHPVGSTGPADDTDEWATSEYRYFTPGGRFELVIHTAFPPARLRTSHVAKGSLVVWDHRSPQSVGHTFPRLVSDLSTSMGAGPELTALAQAYAHMFTMDDPGTPEAAALIDVASFDMTSSQAHRLKLLALPTGCVKSAWMKVA